MNSPASHLPSSGFPAPRVTPNAAHAFGGIWRFTVRRYFTWNHWLVLAGAFAVLALFAIGAGRPGNGTHHYVDWIARLYVCFLVPLLAFIAGGSAMRDDFKADAVDYLFTRPVRRPVFVVFRYLSQLACAQFDFLLALGVLVGLGAWFHSPGLWEALPRIALAQVLLITSFTAFGFLCAALTARYVVVGLLYGVLVEVGIGNVPTQLSRFSMLRHALGVLQPVLDGAAAKTSGAIELGVPATIAVLVLFAAVMVAATAVLFGFKEFAGAGREN